MRITLQDMMNRRKLNQRELSERSGVPQGMISEIVTGKTKNPTVGTLSLLARAMSCTVDDLIEPEQVA